LPRLTNWIKGFFHKGEVNARHKDYKSLGTENKKQRDFESRMKHAHLVARLRELSMKEQ
jgi:hypothetical protein